MAARRSTGLDAAAVAALQARLDEGKKPRVALSGPQFPDGVATGTVVRIGDEASDGADFITVRVTVNGVADELAFAPNELELPRRGSKAAPPSARATANRPAAPRATGSTANRSTANRNTANRSAAPARPADTAQPASQPSPQSASPTSPAPSVLPATTAASTSASAKQSRPAAPAAAPSARRPAPARKKAGAAPVITLTVTSSGASWSVSGQRGAKSVAKSVPIAPGVITAIAELLAVQAISAAVAEVNETALAEAEERAARLRAELAELDAVLAAHRSPR
jgi:hypothetical protein